MTRRALTAIVKEAARLQRRGLFIESIKYLRQATGAGLIEAHRAATLLRERMPRRPERDPRAEEETYRNDTGD